MKEILAKHPRVTGYAVWALRLIVGGVFIFSGLVKAIDIWGFVYKIEEYLTIWGVQVPRSLAVIAAMAMTCYEFIFGVLLAVGTFRRVAVWAIGAFMTVMLPLTLYILVADPVSDCGCFGEAFRLSNTATFLKNLFIVAALLPLFWLNRSVEGLYRPWAQWLVGVGCFIYIMVVALIGFNVQPMIDFRSFPVGEKIIHDSNDDSNFSFVFQKNGVNEVFEVDSLPDSTWTFVARISNNPNVDAPTDLVIFDEDEDVTEDIVYDQGEQIIVVVPQFDRADVSYTYAINELYKYITAQGGSLIEVASIPSDRMEDWRDLSMAEYPIYKGESTMLKELARGDMAAVYVVDGIIRWKRNLASIDVDLLSETSSGENALDRYDFHGPRMLLQISGGLVAYLLLLLLSDNGERLLKWLRRHSISKILSKFAKRKE